MERHEPFIQPVEHSLIENTLGAMREEPDPEKRLLLIESLQLRLSAEYLNTIDEHPEANDPFVNSDLTMYLNNGN